MSVLVSRNYGGNIHSTVRTVNREGLGDYVLSIDSDGYNTIVVYRLPEAHPEALKSRRSLEEGGE